MKEVGEPVAREAFFVARAAASGCHIALAVLLYPRRATCRGGTRRLSAARMRAPVHPRDPIGWSAVLVLVFLALASVRLTIPTELFFDEVHYVPAARTILDLSAPRNVEHPPLGKELIALGMALLGDRPLGWRIMPLLFGALTLFSAMRAMWFASCSRAASLLTGFYLVIGFPLLVQARIAMLDIFMLGSLMVALWMCAGAVREAETARWRLVMAGTALGAAMAAKWNAVPLAVLPGVTFFAIRLWCARGRCLWARRGAPVPGMTLVEAFIWLGLLPLAVYAANYWPFLLFADTQSYFQEPNILASLVALHEQMMALQTGLLKAHPYQSTWLQWVLNWRAIWYLYEPVNGAQRGVLLVGNPLAMLAGLPALVWCVWAGLRGFSQRVVTLPPAADAPDNAPCEAVQAHSAALAVALLYAVSLGMWIVAPKPVQFYYHYALPSCFLLAALALATEAMWRRGRKALAAVLMLGSAALFVWFYPILTAAPLSGERAFMQYSWLDSWR